MSDYEPGKLLREVRAKISSIGTSEQEVASMASMQEMFDKIQDLREEMNEAKKAAAAKAAEPYIELIKQVESRYAFILKLKSGSK